MSHSSIRLGKRPQPRGGNLDSPLPPDAMLKSDEDLNVSYHAGVDSVAHDAAETTRAEAIASKVDMKGASHRVGRDPS